VPLHPAQAARLIRYHPRRAELITDEPVDTSPIPAASLPRERAAHGLDEGGRGQEALQEGVEQVADRQRAGHQPQVGHRVAEVS
jgi:hypothetical protein